MGSGGFVRAVRRWLFLLVLAGSGPATSAQSCGQWAEGLFPIPGIRGVAKAMATFDDGSGPALYVGGDFSFAGSSASSGITRFQDGSFSPLGRGIVGEVHALAVFDGDQGEALYIAGDITFAGGAPTSNVARWDGETYSTVAGGFNDTVRTLLVFDDGSGPALYAGGDFSSAGGSPAAFIARYDGESWEQVGRGLLDAPVWALASFDSGSGPELYAGGDFFSPLQRFDGTRFLDVVGLGPNEIVRALAVYDDGQGSDLYVGGSFQFSNNSHIYTWDGSTLTPLPQDVDSRVLAFAVFDDGAGESLFVGGGFGEIEGVRGRIARWDGTELTRVGIEAPFGGAVQTLLPYDDGAGPELFIGGFLTFGIGVNGIARWDGQDLSGLGPGFDAAVGAFLEFDDGTGSDLYVAGPFQRARETYAPHLARFDGTSFTPVGPPLNRHVITLANFDDGSGPALYVGGNFSRTEQGLPLNFVAKVEGGGFTALGSGLDRAVRTLETFDDGTGVALYAGGDFVLAGGNPANRIARWDGASWSPLGSGLDGFVSHLAAFDDGAGPALYAAGPFSTAGGVPAENLARWDGTGWSAIPSAIDFEPTALEVLDDGNGRALFIGAFFPDSVTAGLLRYDGTSLTTVAPPVYRDGNTVRISALEIFDDGSGPSLYVGGYFSSTEGSPLASIARWDGSSYSPLGIGIVGSVLTLASFDDGKGSALYAGGSFARAGGNISTQMAKWSVEPAPCRSGNVATRGGAPPADVLFVNGSSGDPDCRRVGVPAYTQVPIDVQLPPGGGSGHYALWILDGATAGESPLPLQYRNGQGIFDLGTGCRGLPTLNLINPGTISCFNVLGKGKSSRRLGRAAATVLCLPTMAPSPRAPMSFADGFPPGTYVVCGVIVDPDSANATPVSIMNWVVVESE